MPTMPIEIDRDLPALEVIPGLTILAFFGLGFSVNFARWEPQTLADEHVHAEEQLVVMLEGELIMSVEGQHHHLKAGDALYLASGVPHQGKTESSAAYQLDVFSPPRESVRQLLASRGMPIRVG